MPAFRADQAPSAGAVARQFARAHARMVGVDIAGPDESLRDLANRTREQFPGLHLTSGARRTETTEDRPMPEATRNPYDRRDPPQRGHADMGFASIAGRPMLAHAGEFVGASAIALEDLQAMTWSASQRAARAEAERLMEQHAEDKLAAQRTAWAEGHREGVEDGRNEVLRESAEQFEPRVGAALDVLQAAIKPEGSVSDRQRIEDLQKAANIVQDLLTELRHAHHNGFRELPF